MRLPAPEVPIELQLLQRIADDVAGIRAAVEAKPDDRQVDRPADGERVTLEEPVRPDPAPDAPKAPAKPATKKAPAKKTPASGGASK